MRSLVTATVAFTAFAHANHAFAQTGWVQGFAMGTTEAAAFSRDKTRFGIYCASGQQEQNAGIMLEVKGPLARGQTRLVELIVGAQHFVFLLSGTVSIEDTISGKNQLMMLEDALIKNRGMTFVVKVPDLHWQQEYSTSGAKAALSGDRPGSFMTDECTRP